MSTSRDELLALADAMSALNPTNRKRAAIGITPDDQKMIVSALRLAATPKAGVEREVIARIIYGVYGVGYGGYAGAHQNKSIERAADAILSLSVGEQEIVQEKAHATKQPPSRAEDSATETAIGKLRAAFQDARDSEFAVFPLTGHGIDAHRREWAKDSRGREVLECGQHGYGMLFDIIDILNAAYEVVQLSTDTSHSNEQSAQGLSRATGGDA